MSDKCQTRTGVPAALSIFTVAPRDLRTAWPRPGHGAYLPDECAKIPQQLCHYCREPSKACKFTWEILWYFTILTPPNFHFCDAKVTSPIGTSCGSARPFDTRSQAKLDEQTTRNFQGQLGDAGLTPHYPHAHVSTHFVCTQRRRNVYSEGLHTSVPHRWQVILEATRAAHARPYATLPFHALGSTI